MLSAFQASDTLGETQMIMAERGPSPLLTLAKVGAVRKRLALLAGFLFLGLLLLPAISTQAQAQGEPDAELATIEEVIVTARKRQESLQETPISITAFSEADLEQANMIDLRDIGKFTPGMSFTSYGMGSAEAGAIFLRGIGQSDHMVTTDPGVGLYIDGVYMGRNQGAALDLLDLERVEVLRGPQGTLFGKNTIGGAVNVVSRKPSGEPGGHVGATFGEDGRINLEASAEFGLSDGLAFRAGILSRNRDGVGEQVFTGDELGDEDSLSGRAQLYWSGANSELSVVLDAGKARQGAVPHSFYEFADWMVAFFGAAPCFTSAGSGQYAPCASGADADPFDSYSLDDLDTEQDLFGVSATWQWDLSETLTLKSITAYRDMEYVGNLEFDGAPQVVVHYLETGASDQFSQEIQLLGENEAGTVNWIAGLYYFTEDGHNLQNDNQFGALDQRRSQVETQSYAAFGQVTVDLSESFSLTAGLRYTDEEKDYDIYYQSLDATGAPAVDDGGQLVYRIPPSTLGDSWDAVSGTVNGKFQVSDELMLYATYSRGFRSGGFAARPAAPASVGAYDPEYVDMFEVGLKAQAFDDRMRLNVSAYTSDYEDYQAQVNRVGNAFDTRVLNAAEAEIDGFEVELTALFSPWFRVVATLGYTDAEITKVDLDPSLEANFAKGSQLPYVSKVTYSISPQAMWPLANGASLLLRADYAYRDDFYGQIANSPFEKEDGYGLLNARIEFSSPGERWRLALYGINLADKKYTRVRNYYPGFLGFALWNTDRREIGVTARYEF
ncbi:MAG: TonB-dependent receptor [Gammaproteobacteria bacterium]|nr:TonB-dependent receptor [Gammaproteobacteria bacterium]